MTRGRPVAFLLACALCVASLSACDSSEDAAELQSQRKSYALPSDGWTQGHESMSARISGTFHASRTSEGACAWIDNGEIGFVWPDGYRVRFKPTELLDERGRVVATEGEHVEFGGGHAPSSAATRCNLSGLEPWHVQSARLDS